ncbi:MAG: hypothetical protein J5506_06370 [Prevotella sp.]|nr:hypothetical protein [Prevotella sp.]
MNQQPSSNEAMNELQRHEAALRYTDERQELFLMLEDMVKDEVARQMVVMKQRPKGFWSRIKQAISNKQ